MKVQKKEKKNFSKNSPTGIRTPVFHVTGEDTNQLYYWRLLNKGQDRVDEAAKGKGVGKKEERKSGGYPDKYLSKIVSRACRYPDRPVRVGLSV